MKIHQMKTVQDKAHFKELSIEYLSWITGYVDANFEVLIEGDVVEYVEEDMKTVEKLMPPTGHLLLCEIDRELAGMAGMRQLRKEIAEIKRMYTRPKFRGRGIARKMLGQLIDIAKEKNYLKVRLDSGRFMGAAHGLYRSFGFTEIEPYEGSEVPPELQRHWIFFECSLTK